MQKYVLVSVFLFCFASVSAQRLNQHYYRAQAAIDNKNLETALSWIDSSAQSLSRNPYVWLKKGEILFKLKRFTDAAECFNTAESFRKGIALYWIAKTYAIQGNEPQALQYLEKHLSSAPKEHEATILLDTAFNAIKQSKQWKEFWLNDWYTSHERFLAEIYYYMANSDFDIALELLNDKMHGKRSRHQLYALRGEVYLKINSPKAAEADFKQALKRSKRNHEYMYKLAISLLVQNKHKKVSKILAKAIDLSGGEPIYYKTRALAFASDHDYSNALNDTKHYLSFYPNCLEANEMLASYSIASGKSIDALLQLGKLIKENPAKENYYLLRAKLYMETQKWEVAIIDLNKAIELNPSLGDAYLNRGICFVNVNKSTEACADWQKAIKLGIFKAQELSYKHCK